jgi:hypothetical protein
MVIEKFPPVVIFEMASNQKAVWNRMVFLKIGVK